MQRLNIFRSRFFWKLYLTFCGFFFVIIVITAWQSFSYFKKSLDKQTKLRLKNKLSLLEPMTTHVLTDHDKSDLDQLVKSYAAKTGTDVVILDENRQPLVEHKDLYLGPEFEMAANASFGITIRLHAPANASYVFMAKKINSPSSEARFIRVGIPLDPIVSELREIRYVVTVIAVVGLVIVLFFGLYVGRRVSEPIAEMVSVCDAIRQGDYDQRVSKRPDDEIGKLGETLNQLADEVTSKIATISLERAQLKTMLTGMVEGIIALDENFRVQFCNRAAYNLLNVKTEDCRGLQLKQVEGFDVLLPIAKLAARKKRLVEEELRLDEADQESRLIDVHASSLETESSNDDGVIILLHDITNLRRLEKVRTDFVANVSHEIKTPLTSIKGYVETLLGGALDDVEVNRRFLGKVDQNATRLMNIVQDLLNLAQLDSHDEMVNLKPIDWGPIVSRVLAHYEDVSREKDLKISLKELQSPIVVMGDTNSMEQVVDNLVTNAIRYTPQGGSVTVTLKKDNGQGLFEVEDTGIGIPEKYRDRIFERFYRVDKARSREAGGTGLGLAIVKHLLSRMGGSISVDSEIGIGSKFKVSLNLAH